LIFRNSPGSQEPILDICYHANVNLSSIFSKKDEKSCFFIMRRSEGTAGADSRLAAAALRAV
jgi:hypothetical protein